jgi:hypothetical protein
MRRGHGSPFACRERSALERFLKTVRRVGAAATLAREMQSAPPMKFWTVAGLGSLLIAFAGCSSASSEPGAPAAAEEEGALGDSNSPVITFASSGAPSLSGRLVAGSRVAIHYAPERLPQCRSGANDGSPAWIISGFSSLNGEAPQAFYVAGHDPDGSGAGAEPSVKVPASGDLALWFQVHDVSGCNAYDSDYGANFHFSVPGPTADDGARARATVRFGGSGAPSVEGDVVAGGMLEVDYDASRLPQCRGDRNGQPAWTITGFASSNDGPARPFYVAGLNSRHEAQPTEVPVPEAGTLALWFQVTSGFGCSEYDSNLGANYSIAVRGN